MATFTDKVNNLVKALTSTAKYNLNASQLTAGGGGTGAFGSSTQPTQAQTSLSSYNTDFTNTDAYKQLQSSINSLGNAAKPIDLSGIIADYNRNNQATIDTLNKTLSDTVNTLRSSNEQSRNDLLTSLKRFQESNAESMRTQQQDFNASRASLEDESFMNQRNTLANTASRGLGGSGLQQLAQLQNRLAAGKNINTLAQKNQNVQDALRKAMTQQQQDYDTKVSNLEKNLANAITQAQNETAAKINAANTNNTNLINNLIYNEQVRQQQAAAQASSAKASLNNLLSSMREGVTRLQGTETALDVALEQAKSSYLADKKKSDVSKLSSKQQKELESNLNTIYNNYLSAISDGDLAASYGLDNSYTNTAISNLKNIYNRYTLNPTVIGNAGFR